MRIDPSQDATDIFQKAYEEYKDQIFRYCLFHVYDRDVALDVTQEAFMKTWEYISQGNTIENVRAFLYTVATNVIRNAARKKKESSLEALQEAGFDPPSEDAARDRDFIAEEQAMLVLHELEEPYRTAVTLRFVEGFSPAEIAEITRESANAVSVRIHRGVDKLSVLLKRKGHG